ncbi:MAG: TolC family protein [Spirochaetia bacterium]|nr:TolC family protein [Spirochaetia bacterium]
MYYSKYGIVKNKLIFLTLVYFISLFSAFAVDVSFFIKEAFKNNPSLKANAFEVEKEKAAHDSESLFLNATNINLGYNNIPISNIPSLDSHMMSNVSIGISQNIAFPWESSLRKSAAYEKFISEKDKFTHKKNVFAYNIRNIYEKLMFLIAKKEILRKNEKALENILKTSRALVSVNRMASSQLLKIEADISFINSNILKIEAETEKKKYELNLLCGVFFDWVNINLSTADWIYLSDNIIVPENIDVENTALYNQYKNFYESQKTKESLGYASLWPSVMLGINYSIRQEIAGKDKGEDFISVNASMPFPLHYAYKEKYQIIKNEKAAQAAYENWLNIENDIKMNWQGEKNKALLLKEAYKIIEKEVLPKYYASYMSQVSSLSAGNLTLIDVLDSYRRYLEVSLEKVKTYYELRESILKLDYYSENYPAKENLSNNN